jgi:hypothetical protein
MHGLEPRRWQAANTDRYTEKFAHPTSRRLATWPDQDASMVWVPFASRS